MRRVAVLLLALTLAGPAQAQLRNSLLRDEANPRLMEGLERRTLSVGGVERVYYVHLPAGLRGSAPVVFALHGGAGTAPRRARQMGLNAIADREGFVAVYPQGINNGWNDGRGTADLVRRQAGADDVAFFRAMMGEFVRRGEADEARIYVVGGSNGGMMTHRLACDLADRIAGAVAMVASLPEPVAPRCKPAMPVPILMMNGDADPLVPYEGGQVGAVLPGDQGRILPVEETVRFWLRANGCAGEPRASKIEDKDPADGVTVEVRRWQGCQGGAAVAVYRMRGAGHGLPGRSANKSEAAERLGGRSTNDFDSSEHAWAFLKGFRR